MVNCMYEQEHAAFTHKTIMLRA